MNPSPVTSPPTRGVSRAPDQPAPVRRGAAQTQFQGVENAQQSTRGDRPESPRPHRHGVFGALRGAFSHIGGASKSHAAHHSGAAQQGTKADQLVKLDRQAERQHVDNLFENFTRIGERLTQSLQQTSLTHDEARAVLSDLGRLGHGMRTLTLAFVEGDDGQPRRLLGLSDQAVGRIQSLAQSRVVGGQSVDGLVRSAQRGALAQRALAIPTVRQFLGDTQRALLDLAKSTGHPQWVQAAGKLFQQPGRAPAAAPRAAAEQKDPDTYPNADGSFGGARFGNPLNKEAAATLSNGHRYYAHVMGTRDGIQMGTACAFPMRRDMPDFCRLVQDRDIRDIVVLTSRSEILASAGNGSESKHLPFYFGGSHTWGEGDNRHHIESTKGDVRQHGLLKVQEYPITITGPDGRPTPVKVHHVDGWGDHETVPEEDAIRFAIDLFKQIDARGGSFGEVLTHCRAGFGRTGLMEGIYALIQNPNRTTQDLLTDMRVARGPGMVQTRDQQATLDAARNLLHHLANSDDTFEDIQPDWPRQSLIDPHAPADGDPVYVNVPQPRTPPVPPRAPRTDVDAPPPLPPRQRAQPQGPGAQGVDPRHTPPPKPQRGS